MLFSVRGAQSTVKHQHDRPTCVAFAVTALHEHAYDVLGGSKAAAATDLSEEFLYYHCKERDNLGLDSTGTTVWAASASLALHGQALESLCPYQRSLLSSSLPAPSKKAQTDGKKRLLPGLRRLDLSVASIRDYLRRSRPLVAVLDWYSNAYVTRSGILDIPGEKDRFLGRHAVLIVELEEKGFSEDCVITFKNSWGPKWGNGGFGSFELEYFSTYGREIWGITA